MSHTHKIDRARRAHLAGKAWKTAYGRELERSGNHPTADDYARARATARQALIEQGLDTGQLPGNNSSEDQRTCGVRYGNQRHMRAMGDLKARRADRKRDPAPELDADGELALQNRPDSPAKRRGPRWT